MRKLIYGLPIVLLFGVNAVYAQDARPITDAIGVGTAQNDQSVSLRGEIVKQEARNQYLLSDGTGNVLVEIRDGLLKGNRLAPGTEVEIEGKVDVRLLKDPKVDAQSVTVFAASSLPKYRDPGPEQRG